MSGGAIATPGVAINHQSYKYHHFVFMQKPKPNSSKESLRRKIEVEEKIRHEREIVTIMVI